MKNGYDGSAPDNAANDWDDMGSKKVLFVISISKNLDPNLKNFLNSLKTALLMRTMSLRLVIIIEGEQIIAGQDSNGQRVKSEIPHHSHLYTDLAHFLTSFEFEN